MALTHPRVVTRDSRAPETITQVIARSVLHVLVYVPTPERKYWVDQELRIDTTVQVAHEVEEVVAALVEDSRARPQVLVIDVDPLSAGELFHLHHIRERGWCGAIIALGQVPPSLRASLQITRVIRTPLVENALAEELGNYRFATQERTMPCPIFPERPSPVHKTFG
jgi:hypothetical protein